MPALADQVQVDLAKRRQEAVRVVGLNGRVAVTDLKPVVAKLTRQDAGEQPLALGQQRAAPAISREYRDRLREGP